MVYKKEIIPFKNKVIKLPKRNRKVGNDFLKQTTIIPIGTIERFHRIIPRKYSLKFRRFAFKIEKFLPKKLNLILTISQLVEYKNIIKH